MRHKLFVFLFVSILSFSNPMHPLAIAEEKHHEHGEHEHDEHEGHVHEETEDEGHGHKEDEHDHHDESGVHLTAKSQEIVGLKIVQAKKMPLVSSIEVVGEIAQDTENMTHITVPESGVIKSLAVNVGDVVDKDVILGSFVTNGGKTIEIVSPAHGIVMAKYVKENENVDVISSILTIANPDLLRASFNVYEKDLAGLKSGLRVVVNSMAYPDKQFEGELVFVSPQLDVKTRAVRVRANVKNEEHLLKFGMYVTGKILVPMSEETLIVPEEAIQNIKEETVVFIPEGKEHFEKRAVKTGREASGFVEITAGLQEGENVVGQGSFYLKSELLKGELGHGHAH